VSEQLTPLQTAETDAIRSFLARAFSCDLHAPFLEPALLQWKCFAPRPDWPGPRSFLLRREGQIASYGCVTPIDFQTAAGPVTGVHLIDWGGDPKFKGAGTLVMLELGKLRDINMTLGGSPATRKILPRLGFRIAGDMEIYARPVRPFLQVWSTPRKNWKTPLRLARNLMWSARPLASPGAWSAQPIAAFDDSTIAAVHRALPSSYTLCRRSAGQLNYMLQCPAAQFSACLLLCDGSLRGYFVLSQVGHQARLADVQLDSEQPQDWAAAVSAAVTQAASNPATYEVIAGGSIPLSRNALVQNGFRVRDHKEVFLFDPRGLLSASPPPHFNLIEADCSYVSDPLFPFLT